jgi:hypothetical protein
VADGGALFRGDALVVDGVFDSGIAGRGGTAVPCFADPLTISKATTSATTRTTAAPAAIHNQRGGLDCPDEDLSGGGSAGGTCPYCHCPEDGFCVQECGNCSVGA